MSQIQRTGMRIRKAWKEMVREPEFSFLLALYCVVTFMLFFLFVNQARGFYRSDLTAHIATALKGKGYSINSIFLRIAYKITGEYGCAAYLTLVVITTMILTGIILKKIFDKERLNYHIGCSKAQLIAVCIFFIGGIYIPNIYPLFYLTPNYTGLGSASSMCTQPWHNSTYLLMRLFGLITIILFFRIHSEYLNKKISIKDWALFVVTLTLTNAAKPNFFIAFAPAMLIILIYDCFKQKGKGFLRMVLFGTGVLISMPVLFFQKDDLYPEGTVPTQANAETTHGIEFTTQTIERIWREGTLLPYLVTGLCFFVLITVLCKMHHEMRFELIFGWIMLIISILESWFIAETGPRRNAGNFGWGVYFYSFIMMLICIERLIVLKPKINNKALPFILSPLILMLITGITYFAHLLGGGDFIA